MLHTCIPQVRIENSAAPSAYSVVIDADQAIIDGITTNWSTASQYFTPFDFTQPGALNIQGRGNFQTANPVQITVQVPPNVRGPPTHTWVRAMTLGMGPT